MSRVYRKYDTDIEALWCLHPSPPLIDWLIIGHSEASLSSHSPALILTT